LSKTNIFLNSSDQDKCEYLIGVDWFDGLTVSRENAKSVRGQKLGITQHIYTELKNNCKKIEFIKNAFSVKFRFS